MRHATRWGAAAVAAVVVGAHLSAEQWTGWRGAGRGGVSAVTMPATLASKATDVWAVPVGAGHASPVVDGDRVYVFARRGEQEVAQAIDLATGKTIWRDAYDQPYTMNSAATGHGKGPKCARRRDRQGRVAPSVRQGVPAAARLRDGDVAARRQRPPDRARRRHQGRGAAGLRPGDRSHEVELER
jgi:hypothetical protein